MAVTGESAKEILLVDDEPCVSDVLEALLRFDGYRVQRATCGHDALALFDSRSFDLVITDFSMPGMNGGELAKAIKTRVPDQPIMMVTAYSEILPESDWQQNVNLILGKPFHMRALLDRVKNLVSTENRSSALSTESSLSARMAAVSQS